MGDLDVEVENLKDWCCALEDRIAKLEAENVALQAQINDLKQED